MTLKLFASLTSTVAVLAVCDSALAAGKVEPPRPGFDRRIMDRSIDACTDFFQHVCGGWLKKNPVPADQSRWGRFDELRENNLHILRGILESAAKAKQRDDDTQRLGDFYAACMDEKTIEKKGLAPLAPMLSRIAALADKSGVPEVLAALHAGGVPAFFGFGPMPDMKNAGFYLAAADQGGLGLPDRDYYFREDAKSAELRARYVAHVGRVFELAGDKPEVAAAKAKTVMELETKLAKVSMDVVSRRDPTRLYHKMTLAELGRLSPAFDWADYLEASPAAPRFDGLNVVAPSSSRG